MPTRPSLASEVTGTLANWLKGELHIAAILALVYTVGFALTQVPLWFLIGPVAGLLFLVPLVGGPAGLLLALAASFLAQRSFSLILATAAVWIVTQAIEGFYLTPRILGKRTKLSQLAVFTGTIAASALFGPLGVLFAVPVMAIVLAVWRYIDHRRHPQTS